VRTRCVRLVGCGKLFIITAMLTVGIFILVVLWSTMPLFPFLVRLLFLLNSGRNVS
jgi:hypothetical protein